MGQFVVMPRLTFRFHPSGHLWSANTGEYRLVQRTLEGDTVRIVEREYARLPVTAEERDSIQRELEALPPPLRAEAPEIPAHKPVFERIHLDGEGNVFVQIIGERADQGRIFDVLDREGRYLGRIHSGVRFTTYRALPLFVGDRVYGVTTDSLGVDYVVRARIERPE